MGQTAGSFLGLPPPVGMPMDPTITNSFLSIDKLSFEFSTLAISPMTTSAVSCSHGCNGTTIALLKLGWLITNPPKSASLFLAWDNRSSNISCNLLVISNNFSLPLFVEFYLKRFLKSSMVLQAFSDFSSDPDLPPSCALVEGLATSWSGRIKKVVKFSCKIKWLNYLQFHYILSWFGFDEKKNLHVEWIC